MNIVTEIVKLKTIDGFSKEDFIGVVNDLEMNFHLKLPGYIDSELLLDEKDGQWIIIQHWDSMDNLKNASEKMFKEDCTKVFRSAIDSKEIEICIYPQVRSWSIENDEKVLKRT